MFKRTKTTRAKHFWEFLWRKFSLRTGWVESGRLLPLDIISAEIEAISRKVFSRCQKAYDNNIFTEKENKKTKHDLGLFSFSLEALIKPIFRSFQGDQNSDPGNKKNGFSTRSSYTIRKLAHKRLTEEKKSVVLERHDFEIPDKSSNISTFQKFRTIKILIQGANSRVFVSKLFLQTPLFVWYLDEGNQLCSSSDFWVWKWGEIELISFLWNVRTIKILTQGGKLLIFWWNRIFYVEGFRLRTIWTNWLLYAWRRGVWVLGKIKTDCAFLP